MNHEYFLQLDPLSILPKQATEESIVRDYNLKEIKFLNNPELIDKLLYPFKVIIGKALKLTSPHLEMSLDLILRCISFLESNNSKIIFSKFAANLIYMINNGVYFPVYRPMQLQLAKIALNSENIELKKIYLVLVAFNNQSLHYKTQWIQEMPDSLVQLLSGVLFKEPENQLALSLILPYMAKKFSPNEIKYNKQCQYFPGPIEFLRGYSKYSQNDRNYMNQILRLAYFFTFPLFSQDFNKSQDYFVKLGKFVELSDSARSSFLYSIYISFLSPENVTIIPTFFQNLRNPAGRSIMASLFTYIKSEEYSLLISKFGYLFFQFFYTNRKYIPEDFILSLEPLNFELSNFILDFEKISPSKNTNLYLQSVYNAIIRFSSFDFTTMRSIIEENSIRILKIIYNVRNLIFNVPNLYSIITMDYMFQIFTLFFDFLGKIFDDFSSHVSILNEANADSILLCLKYIMLAQIPDSKSDSINFHANQAYNSIITFISKNKDQFRRVLLFHYRPSLILPLLVIANHVKLPEFMLLKLLSYASHATTFAMISSATVMLKNLPINKEIANGLINESIKRSLTKKNDEALRSLETYLYFIAILIEFSPHIVSFLIESPNYDVFINSIKNAIFNSKHNETYIALAPFLILLRNLKVINPSVTIELPYEEIFTLSCIKALQKYGAEALIDIFIQDFILQQKPYTFDLQLKLLSKYKINNVKTLQDLIDQKSVDIVQPVFEKKDIQYIPWQFRHKYFDEIMTGKKVCFAKLLNLNPDQIPSSDEEP
ncbi:hypothetical protein TVAG_483560 [Trichomonas vaginalis G3]|uniref:Uncharacterized protein n=1 Tax=Trichomonas vaginalis (strain ATCC PRA-98 / G3) TaxID=412133 RepID=A2ETC8_TRIV3|nr:hypothetical protein TVAGG3_0620560 [Trichomonas vaginalis G3]EAY04118.1 hypothetical protein TVAG_483560 [Trichomonas vaginalis G3]KAI5503868.1 hypothetical protein TVAGG3_0620560 [Trichomonas vaginalis G3]|eukprot:XP_001316341.1 hypothetical protein [Trichomonas vaginalis G3]